MALLSRRFLAHRPRPHIVIVGGNYAGLAAARTLDARRVQVTLIDSAPRAEWLPNVHELLSRRKIAEQLQRPRQELLRALGHDFLCASVSHIDRVQQRVLTHTGQHLDYDLLLLATGSRANDHGIPGVSEHALQPRSVEHGLRIGNALTRLAALPAGRDVVIAGGGIEGLEMLGEILQRFGSAGRLNLHLVEQAPVLFPRFPGLHERMLASMQDQVQLHMGRRITAVSASHVQLDDGHELPSRLTIWSTGRCSQPLAASAGLATTDADAPVQNSLQSTHDARIFIAGDAAQLPHALEKQAHYAQGMGVHAARNMQRMLDKKMLHAFKPLLKPAVLAFGDRDGVLFYGRQALASPALIALKEAAYQYGINRWQPPQSGREFLQMAESIQRGISARDTWQLLVKAADSRLFQAHR
jgi:NADH dehydrogenase FAD-containing subunit